MLAVLPNAWGRSKGPAWGDTITLLQSCKREMFGSWQVVGECGVVLKSLQGTHINQSPLLIPAKPWHMIPSQKYALGKAIFPLPSHLAHIPDSTGMQKGDIWTTSLEKQLNSPSLLNHRLFTSTPNNTKLKKEKTTQLKIKLGVWTIIWDCALYLPEYVFYVWSLRVTRKVKQLPKFSPKDRAASGRKN